jgi:hypothetical protein
MSVARQIRGAYVSNPQRAASRRERTVQRSSHRQCSARMPNTARNMRALPILV